MIIIVISCDGEVCIRMNYMICEINKSDMDLDLDIIENSYMLIFPYRNNKIYSRHSLVFLHVNVDLKSF